MHACVTCGHVFGRTRSEPRVRACRVGGQYARVPVSQSVSFVAVPRAHHSAGSAGAACPICALCEVMRVERSRSLPSGRTRARTPPRPPVPPCRTSTGPRRRRSRDTRPLYGRDYRLLADRSRRLTSVESARGCRMERRPRLGRTAQKVWVNSLTVWSIICQFGRFSIFLMTVFVFLRPGGFGN